MKIKKILVHGFRGFNEPREIVFDERITLISAPNSYGKTSISEAFEWLLYGATSKVEKAGSKDEYKGSYRNVHLPSEENPTVTLSLTESESQLELQAELSADQVKKYMNGKEVANWPFEKELVGIPRPFILQHALKNLLLATPIERFADFARFLGFEELGTIHHDLMALCTKPPLPQSVSRLVADINSLQGRIAGRVQFAPIAKGLKQGESGLKATYDLIRNKCREYVSKDTDESSILPRLLALREEAVGKIFRGKIDFEGLSEQEQRQNVEDEDFLTKTITDDLMESYSSLEKLQAFQRIKDLSALHDAGLRLLEEDRTRCPLCTQSVSEDLFKHIREVHDKLQVEKKEFADLEDRRNEILQTLRGLEARLTRYHSRISGKTTKLLAIETSLHDLASILLPKHQTHYDAVVRAIAQLKEIGEQLNARKLEAEEQIKKVLNTVERTDAKKESIKDASAALVSYIAVAAEFIAVLDAHTIPIRDAAQVLKYELDVLAGMQDVSILVDLLEKRGAIRKKLRIDAVLEGLKLLRQEVDNFVSQIMLDAISGDFASDVMDWYKKIRTTGDPDVHFSGFDMKKTAQGGRVQIKARSYKRDLVSAVSSLSESKLNALGLCMSIAINTKTPSPFEFLIIDDPIQSWDEGHATKFIEVIRELVARGKQVLLLSHNGSWTNRVREQCADLNGIAYEITGYTEEGPHIAEIPWATVSRRLATILGIINDPAADQIKLQQAEQEVRITLTQLAADIHFNVTGTRRSPHSLNATETKKLLLEGGIGTELVNKLTATFETVDDAHHASPGYAPDRDRIRAYYGWLKELERKVCPGAV